MTLLKPTQMGADDRLDLVVIRLGRLRPIKMRWNWQRGFEWLAKMQLDTTVRPLRSGGIWIWMI
jgi:hypothetical protein